MRPASVRPGAGQWAARPLHGTCEADDISILRGFPLMGVPQNKWFIAFYNGKSHEHGWFRGTPILGNLHMTWWYLMNTSTKGNKNYWKLQGWWSLLHCLGEEEEQPFRAPWWTVGPGMNGMARLWQVYSRHDMVYSKVCSVLQSTL